jgi:hypothetical protein
MAGFTSDSAAARGTVRRRDGRGIHGGREVNALT